MKSQTRRALACALPIITLSWIGGSVQAAPIDEDVRAELRDSSTTRVWIHLTDAADLSPAGDLFTRQEKGRFVFDALNETASRSQAAIRAHLDRVGADYRAFYITNAIVVDVDSSLLTWLAARPEVDRITANPQIYMLHDVETDGLPAPEATSTVEWNVAEVGAPQAWALGYTGQGIVVASADTGVVWNHPALAASYRGTEATRVTHDYHWFDAIGGAVTPYDDNGHGTFTTGQMVGEDGANQVGVAPGATWIGCKNMAASGYGTPESYTACFQFFIAPTDTRGRNPNPDLAPDVVNNSWGCPAIEGCDGDTLLDIVNATQAAGVMQVFSAGNSGPGCSSVEDPPATYEGVLTVGAHDSSGSLAGFSSRGPSAFDRSVKPNISAPGVQVRSSSASGGYSNGWSGTSMAAPEVAGAIAILWSADPSLIGDTEGTRSVLEGSAEPVRGLRCGGSRTEGNNMWGRGKLDIPAALAEVTAQAR